MRSWRSVLARRSRVPVSVAMATYNGERFLPEMLESIAAQTRPPDELVVRDDGSADGTVGILEAFARRASFRVHVIAGDERLGYAQNFVAASSECSGDLVFFADQDDSWRPAKLEAVARRVDASRSLAVFHDFALQSDDGTELAPSYYALLAERGFGPAVAIKGCSMAVTRPFLDTWGWPPASTTVSHDFWVALISSAFDQRVNLEEILIDHRLHADNTSGWIPDDGSRAFTVRGEQTSDVDLLLDLVLKNRRLRVWTKTFLDLVDERGEPLDPAAAQRLRRSLRTNRRRHREARG